MIVRASFFVLAIGVAVMLPVAAALAQGTAGPPTAGPITSPLSGIHSAPAPERQEAASPTAPQPTPPAPAAPGH